MKRIISFVYALCTVFLLFSQSAPTVSSISATVNGEQVMIDYSCAIPGQKLILYRGIVPFTGMASLSSAVIANTFMDSGNGYVDYPIPQVQYYYALLGEAEVISGTVFFAAGKNTTVSPVRVTQGTGIGNDRQTVKNTPLPFLNIPEVSLRKNRSVLQPETEHIVKNLVKKAGPPEKKQPLPLVFKEEMGEDGDYALMSIIQSEFKTKRWNECAVALEKFLSLRHTDEVTARATLYLGQAYYFSGQYQKALFSFLETWNTYPSHSQLWVRTALNAID